MHRATSATLGLEGDRGLGLEAVFGLVAQLLQSQLVGAAAHLKHLLKRRERQETDDAQS